MWKVWKFPLALTGGVINMPRRASIIKVAMQHGTITLWAIVNPDEKKKIARVFFVVGTGHEFDKNGAVLVNHVGSVLDGSFVWHVFERVPA